MVLVESLKDYYIPWACLACCISLSCLPKLLLQLDPLILHSCSQTKYENRQKSVGLKLLQTTSLMASWGDFMGGCSVA